MRPKFPSLLMTGIIRIGVTERGSFKNIRKRCISHFSKALLNIKLSLTYSKSPCICTIYLKQAHFQEQKLDYRKTSNFSLIHVL